MWKIAIIDDDFQVLRGLRNAIPWQDLDAEWVGEAIDGESGLKLIADAQPDIVLTDIYMPVMNGIEMIEKLKEADFSGRFVILSGYQDFEYARTAIRLGVEDYLTKPVTLEEIRHVLSATIEKLEKSYLNRLELDQLKTVGLTEQQPLEEWIASLLNGKAGPPELPRPLKDWDNRWHMAMVIEVLRTERIQGISIADWNLFKFAVENIILEISVKHNISFYFIWLFGNYSALLLQESPGSLEIREQAIDLGQRITNSLKTYINLDVRYGIGRVKEGWQDIPDSVNDAMLELFAEHSRRTSSLRESSDDYGGNNHADLNDIYPKLAAALENANDDEAVSLLRCYLTANSSSADEQPVYFQMRAAEVWAMLHHAMLKTGMSNEHEELLDLRELSAMTDPEKIGQWLRSQIQSCRSRIGPAIHEKYRKAVQFMIEYIHANYAEDITLEQLASRLYISKNYLNQLFKKVTGETFTNYVIRVRLEKAKALLLEGNYMVYEISEMVGYQNVPYFTTLFKRYCGVTPSVFAVSRRM